jgi:very-short-patch-repair endonuclease
VEFLLLIAVLIIGGVFVMAQMKGGGTKAEVKQGKATGNVWAKSILTKNEQPMFFRLRDSLPEHIVLAQVSFSALLSATSQADRNSFNRKMADFVVCNKAFEVLAVIELDDSSHNGKEDEDGKRDELLKKAGYNVMRGFVAQINFELGFSLTPYFSRNTVCRWRT